MFRTPRTPLSCPPVALLFLTGSCCKSQQENLCLLGLVMVQEIFRKSQNIGQRRAISAVYFVLTAECTCSHHTLTPTGFSTSRTSITRSTCRDSWPLHQQTTQPSTCTQVIATHSSSNTVPEMFADDKVSWLPLVKSYG
jgi:hypothetical protein